MLKHLAGLLLACVATIACAQNAPVDKARIIAVLPHDATAYTEGLFIRNGYLYESTGVEGQSDIRETRLSDGRVLRRARLPAGIFGEGAVDWEGQIISVSWKEGRGYRWDIRTMRLATTFTYPGEGWGLTRSSRDLFMSDGTPEIRVLDPANFRERRRIKVTDNGRPVSNLNELEWIGGQIWANVWLTNLIARIDPATGRVLRWIDISAISARHASRDPNDVANGIAWDAKTRKIYITGKRWNALYQIEVGDGTRRR